ncbi:aminotransferase class I/II-fold pyridoxal phosphate-dependent enzyme [Streptomyces sp. NBC_01497]|uniref:aminotransferase class I/II-fold pyridoxal phosphate-dependent enzyme n=1 Tax=Streptomyces sp. NBC_01497 TaxID=2903885 RepID=UPI002E370022|nr:aminotransferase class I/II-fold pyridoxal phosphate-dependent enzyme [Streptomyces sp. NBC_01497]
MTPSVGTTAGGHGPHPRGAEPRRTVHEDRGRVRFGPSAPDPGLPALPELIAACQAAASRPEPEPPGGGPALREAACGYWSRRGLRTSPGQITAAPGAPPLLFALLSAIGGDVLLPRPCPAWWTPQIRLLGRPAYHVPTPAECGGVPDPYALLETIRRVRSEGGRPRVLLLCPADDPTGTVAAPDLLHAACEAAVGEGLHLVSDETWRDTLHRATTVLLSPAEMWPGDTTVICDAVGALAPAAWPAAVARFPHTARGLARRATTIDILTALGALVPAPVAAAVAHALTEPDAVRARSRAAAAAHAQVAAAAHRALLAAGALARPPVAGRHLYADLGPLRARLAGADVTDSMDLEEYLEARLGTPVFGGHRFGDELGALRVRLTTSPLLGATPSHRLESVTTGTPLKLPHVAQALSTLAAALDVTRRPATPHALPEPPGTPGTPGTHGTEPL